MQEVEADVLKTLMIKFRAPCVAVNGKKVWAHKESRLPEYEFLFHCDNNLQETDFFRKELELLANFSISTLPCYRDDNENTVFFDFARDLLPGLHSYAQIKREFPTLKTPKVKVEKMRAKIFADSLKERQQGYENLLTEKELELWKKKSAPQVLRDGALVIIKQFKAFYELMKDYGIENEPMTTFLASPTNQNSPLLDANLQEVTTEPTSPPSQNTTTPYWSKKEMLFAI